jgi:2-polyprenyl-6-methoxyphenol hydroxylase-like FAD-dependent oxidoreductase
MADNRKVVVLGAGPCGLVGAMMLARDGHEVLVLERDPSPVPESLDDAWESWERGGVTQFRQAHYLQARGRVALDEGLPGITDALHEAGSAVVDPIKRMPPSIEDHSPRAGDERLTTITARRPVLEFVMARAAENEPRVEVRRGVGVRELTTRRLDGLTHVTGVRTDAGDEIAADLVVDATGRRSMLPRWLRVAGAAPVHEEVDDSGFIYYTRFFRARAGGEVPGQRAALLSPIGSFSLLTVPGDNDTWTITVFTASGDQALKSIRHTDVFHALLAACPLHAHWLDGEPYTDVLPMGGTIGRYRRYVVDGQPVATGIVPLGDAWACTDPALGRGIAFGLAHALVLRDTARAHLGDTPRAFSLAYDEATERELTPWYRSTQAADHKRLAEIHAIRDRREIPSPTDWAGTVSKGLPIAMLRDPEIFRAALEITSCLSLPQEVFARPGLAERVVELAAEHGGNGNGIPGPGREELLEIVSGARSAVRS